jgi:penicillin-binding protein 1C
LLPYQDIFNSALFFHLKRSIIFWVIAFFLSLSALDRLYPLTLHTAKQQYAQIIVAENETPLRAFADHNGIWRYPVRLKQVSPLYIEALLNYEDRWFWHHLGVNPFALIRATFQYFQNGRIISGGSTLTMQVVRLIMPQERTIIGKFTQILRALQLELHYSKVEILNYYLNHAPFGGTLEGVQAASYVYLGKSALELSHAEAALLAVLPQAPSRYRPDRHPEKARQARDKILKRLADNQRWSQKIMTEAMMERVYAQRNQSPMIAPLFARRFRQQTPIDAPLISTINVGMQQSFEALLKNYIKRLPVKTSGAILVVNNKTLAVKAYIGSADFKDDQRFGHVDMITALRSPGSTLKPFLYGLAIDEGFIHSQSLLTDAPIVLKDYRPRNFNRGFMGAVSVHQALTHSLNVPAIQVLYHLTPEKFVSKLKNAGLTLQFHTEAKPNLSVILGGIGTTLESLVATYTALANKGLTGKLRFLKNQPSQSRYLFSQGAAWIVREMLQQTLQGHPNLAWKTGTSYGHRDFWSIGVTNDYTIGVWLGRPDGTSMAGHYGSRTASPLLFEIVARLPEINAASPQPTTVTEDFICWPLGKLRSETAADLCHVQKKAWLLNNTVPKTLPEQNTPAWTENPVPIWVTTQMGKMNTLGCGLSKKHRKTIALWPLKVEPWIAPTLRRRQQIGNNTRCQSSLPFQQSQLKIAGLEDNTQLRLAGGSKKLPIVALKTKGAEGIVYWFINGVLRYKAPSNQHLKHQFKTTGRYQLAVTDETGKTASIQLEVIDNE